jgi:hypothetical protein
MEVIIWVELEGQQGRVVMHMLLCECEGGLEAARLVFFAVFEALDAN